MKTTDINNLIEELNGTIDFWIDNNLFCGGCCFAAYLLARGFEKAGVKFSTIVYQNGYNWNTNKFRRVCSGDGVGHVAICVTYKHRRIVIGSREDVDSRLARSLDWGGPWMIREYRKVTSDDLFNTYYDNEWNDWWDVSNNRLVEEQIDKIFAKYIK